MCCTELDPDEAQEIQNSEILDTFSIEVDEYKGIDPYEFDFINISDADVKTYLRDIKIEKVLEDEQGNTTK